MSLSIKCQEHEQDPVVEYLESALALLKTIDESRGRLQEQLSELSDALLEEELS